MLKLVSLPQLLSARARAKIQALKKFLPSLLLLTGLVAIASANAQEITMPTVDIDGIDEDSDGADIIIIILKYLGKIAIWGAMLYSGFVALKTILKSWNEQKSNDQGRWGAVIGDSLGSVIMVIFVIAVGTWVLSFLS
ncbi:hypothetical protein [Cellvibrio sp. PSBB023]|uniref:hypothetical protein n=1 Tax=Cellvibrio sp. PSBB023 TaxID=1945512 RepID=UPI00098F34A4|nr:hypothetical protein [Cellvibrio sp. PSBB023]AQT61903.1 hypothetical protein B0D95_18675 [Cellvibrio sp. PSBB023]